MNLKKILASVAAAAVAVSGMTVASFAVDTSEWSAAACAFNKDWGGWDFIQSEAGVLTLETTVGALKEKIGVADDSFGGVAVQAFGGKVGEELEYTITIGTVVNESGKSVFSEENGNIAAIRAQYATALNWGNYEFSDDDAVVVTITPVGGVDDEPATDDEPAETEAPDAVDTENEPSTDVAPSADDFDDLQAQVDELANMEGVKAVVVATNKEGDFGGYLYTLFNNDDEGVALSPTDVILVAAAPTSEDTDFSGWTVDLLGFDYSWGGWNGVSSEAGGILIVAATVQEILDANGYTIDDLQGVNLQISGIPAGEYEEGYVVAAMVIIADETVDDGAANSDEEDSETDGTDKVPNTGVVLFAAPAIAAAAGVIVFKKRK